MGRTPEKERPTRYRGRPIYNSEIEIQEKFESVEIPEYGKIQINNIGTKLLTKTNTITPMFMDKSGYLGCYIGGKSQIFLRHHEMVATAFIDNPNGYIFVRHKDGNKLNNCYTNLEWVENEPLY